jgi:hypothetical protein
MIRVALSLFVLTGGLAAGSAQAQAPAAQGAQAPAALVEDINAKNAGVDFMDYVSAGKQIKLGGGETVTLSYLKSCTREVITGGTVTVGADQSAVAGGKVERQTVKCDGGKLALNADQSSKSGAMVFRRAPTRAGGLPEADITLYGTSPALSVPGGGTVVIERLDATADKMEVTVPAQQLRPRAFHDLALEGKSLAAGGTYRASVGSRQIVFRVDPNATSGRAPLVTRLLQFAAN